MKLLLKERYYNYFYIYYLRYQYPLICVDLTTFTHLFPIHPFSTPENLKKP